MLFEFEYDPKSNLHKEIKLQVYIFVYGSVCWCFLFIGKNETRD